MRRRLGLFISGLSLLSGCGNGGIPPSVSIVSPSNDGVVSGIAAIQVTLGDDRQSEVSVYARRRNSIEDGRLLGTVNAQPYILSWNTTSLPTGDGLELYAKATVEGATGVSQPVRVEIRNSSAPILKYVVAYNLPTGLGTQGISRTGVTTMRVDELHVNGDSPALTAQNLQAVGAERQLAVEWSWTPVLDAAGYRVLFSKFSLAGPYDVVKNQAASAGSVAEERYTQFVTDGVIGGQVYGAVRSIPSSGLDSAVSNAGTGVFLGEQLVASPKEGQVVPDGRPILTWNTLAGADRWVYFACDRPCTQKDAKTVWTNYPNMTTQLSAVYPSGKTALPSGTYFWWVAGVRVQGGKAVSLSYSAPRRLVIP